MTESVASRRSVLMIGLDAAEITLIRQWMAEGLLPNLMALERRGVMTELQSTAQWLVGAPWPSFYASTTPDRLGMYHYLVWRPEKMAGERPDPAWMPLEPFWRHLRSIPRRRIVLIRTGTLRSPTLRVCTVWSATWLARAVTPLRPIPMPSR
jgi:predicted AlkP superfamily phosphohydrolase/phosphomutase